MLKPHDVRRIIISRTDNIGDVILTLPVAGVLKELYPNSHIIFLGKSYAKAIIESCANIDSFIDWTELKKLPFKEQISELNRAEADAIIHVFPNKQIAKLAKKAHIPLRLGTSRRVYNKLYCNVKLNLSRRKSELHEAQLNLKLIKYFGADEHYELERIPDYYGFTKHCKLDSKFSSLISKERFNLILHPKSKGSAREWGLDNFSELIEKLPADKYKIFITGTKEEGDLLIDLVNKHKQKVSNLCGQMSLSQLISFIGNADSLVAASTGPLHIAAALSKHAIGIYAPMRPIHPGRWAPIGLNAEHLVLEKVCDDCRKDEDCHCIREITPDMVLERIISR